MLVHSVEEWWDGYEQYRRGRLLFDMTSFIALTALFVFITFAFFSPLGLTLLVCIGLVLLAEMISYNATLKNLNSGGAIPGVYQNGVELPMYPTYATRLFIPWTMMESAWVRRSRILDDVLYISVKGSRWRWRVPGRLFGEEGMRAVIERARGPIGIDIPELEQAAPPRLIIYSAEGARTESVPEET